MRLLVVRHGKSMDRETFAKSGKDDSKRPLSQEGAKLMTDNARGIAELVPDLEGVITSPLTRAIQTANILNDEYGSVLNRYETDSLEPSSDPAEFVDWLESHDLESEVAITGHKPNLNLVVTYLVTGDTDPQIVQLRKGSAMMLTVEEPIAEGSAELEWYLVPEQLRGFSGD